MSLEKSRCGGIIFLFIVATLIILERTAYPAIMPSGFIIVQSTLLKIDGFKLYIDNVETEFLPHNCNWLVSNLMPKYNEVEQVFVEPFLPNHKIGIIHLASGIWEKGRDMRTDKSVKVSIKTLNDKLISKSLRFEN